jgi:FKBP-type peptidyl-prolyl cis-trans isomerase
MRRILLLAASAWSARALTTSSRRRFGLGAASAASAAALAPAQPAAAVREGSTKSGLRFRVEVEGSGDPPKRGQNAMIDYVLRVGVDGKPPLYVDGTKQYGLQARPLQFTLGVGAQIPGFDEAVLDMRVGETRTVIVPPKLGYGANGTEGFDDKIPKDATLIYTLELKSLLPFAPTDAQQKWIAENPNPWDK